MKKYFLLTLLYIMTINCYSIVYENVSSAISSMASFKYDGKYYVVACFFEDVIYDKCVDGVGKYSAPIRIYRTPKNTNQREKCSDILGFENGKYYEVNPKSLTSIDNVDVAYGYTFKDNKYHIYGGANYILQNDGYLILSFNVNINDAYKTYLYVFKFNNGKWDTVLSEKFDCNDFFDLQQIEYNYASKNATIMTHGVFGNVEGILIKKDGIFKFQKYN